MDYRVRSGDTLSGIAAKFDVSLAALEAANPQAVNPNVIYVNELICVPASSAASQQPSPIPTHIVTYVVQAGDTMSAIAAAHNLSLAALEAANPQVTNPNSISTGEILNIPGGATTITQVKTGGVITIGDVTYAQYNGGGDGRQPIPAGIDCQHCRDVSADAVKRCMGEREDASMADQ